MFGKCLECEEERKWAVGELQHLNRMKDWMHLAVSENICQRDGKVKLEDIIDSLKKDLWNHPQDIKEGYTHTSPMMLAEVMVKFLDGEAAELDFYGLCESKSVRFSGISSFTADKQSVQYLQEYLSEHLKYKRQMDDFGEKYGEKWGGFVKELDWIEWQGHMEFLIHRMQSAACFK